MHERAVVLDIFDLESKNPAILFDCQLDLDLGVRGVGAAEQMLPPCLDPFDRFIHLLSEKAQNSYVGPDRQFDAEPAAAVGNDEAQSVVGNSEHVAHVDDAPAMLLIVGPDDEGIVGLVVARDDRPGLQRGGAVSVDPEGLLDHSVGFPVGLLDIPVRQPVVQQHVAAGLLKNQRCRLRDGIFDFDHRLQRLIGHVDQIQGVFGTVGIFRHDGGHGLADIADLVDGHDILLRGSGDRPRRDRLGIPQDLLAGDRGEKAVRGMRRSDIEALDARVRVRAAKERRVITIELQVVDVGSLTFDEFQIFFSRDGFSHPVSRDEYLFELDHRCAPRTLSASAAW